jgi:hypothetical protein
MTSLFLDRSAFHLACFCFYREICLPPIETFLLAVACLLPKPLKLSHPNHPPLSTSCHLPTTTSRLRPPHLTATTRPLTVTSQTAYRELHTEQQRQSTTRPIGSSARHYTTTYPVTPCPPCLLNRNSARWPLSAADLSVRFLPLVYPPQYHHYHLTRQTTSL